jgi:hypothetical protein
LAREAVTENPRARSNRLHEEFEAYYLERVMEQRLQAAKELAEQTYDIKEHE